MRLPKRIREWWRYRNLRFRCINCGEVGRYRWHLEHRKECKPMTRAERRRETRFCPICRTTKGKHKHGAR